MEEREAIIKMRVLQRQRLAILKKNDGKDSQEEDGVLDLMDEVWHELSAEECDYLKRNHPYYDEIIMWLTKEE